MDITEGPRNSMGSVSSTAAEVGDISLLVAVGYDRSAVAFSVLESNNYLSRDLAEHDVKVALWPTEFPTQAGLYLFTGRTTLESLGGGMRREAYHRCSVTSLREGLTPMPAQPIAHNA